MSEAVRTSSPNEAFSIEIVHDQRRLHTGFYDEALDLLIEGYSGMPEEQARQARSAYALRVRLMVQSLLNAGEPFERCLEEERRILMHPGDNPLPVAQWLSPIPLVLVTSFYQPTGQLPQPQVERPGQIWWIDPTTAQSLLETLHQIQWLDLTIHGVMAPEAGSGPYQHLGLNGSAGYRWRPVPYTTA